MCNRFYHRRPFPALAPLWAASCLLIVSGCHSAFLQGPTAGRQFVTPPEIEPPPPAPEADVPRELSKTTLPTYVIEPPDILLIDAIRVIPKPPHTIEPLDALAIRVGGTLAEQPIFGIYPIDTDGRVDLGAAYGKVEVVDMTIDEARAAIREHLGRVLQEPEVSVSLAASAGTQRIAGEHLVTPDGTVNLGTYGSVYVTGMTLKQAETAIEEHLSEFLVGPEVSVDVFAYNSKVYYIITEGGGFGDNVVRAPITGNETVLDAVAGIGGLSQISSKKLWIARPAPNGIGCEQILPINWQEITRGASTSTNYQLLPGDRLFISEDKYQKFDSMVAKLTRPFERIFGFTLLGTQMVSRLNRLPDDTGF